MAASLEHIVAKAPQLVADYRSLRESYESAISAAMSGSMFPHEHHNAVSTFVMKLREIIVGAGVVSSDYRIDESPCYAMQPTVPEEVQIHANGSTYVINLARPSGGVMEVLRKTPWQRFKSAFSFHLSPDYRKKVADIGLWERL